MRNIIHRNRLRLDVIPTLKQINPLFEEAILHLTRQCKDDMDYLEQQAASALSKAEVKDGYCTDAFLQMPKAIRSRAIFQALKRVKNITPSYVQMEQIHKAIEMRNGFCYSNRNGAILCRRKFYFFARGEN